MTTYTTVTNADVDQDSPVTQELMTAMRDNPIAIGEGSPGAPKVYGGALSNVYLGMFTNVSITNTTGTILLGTANGAILYIDAQHNIGGGTSDIDIRFSDDAGLTWGAWQTIGETGSDRAGKCEISLVDGVENAIKPGWATLSMFASKTLTNLPSGNADAIELRTDGSNSFSAIIWLVEGRA